MGTEGVGYFVEWCSRVVAGFSDVDPSPLSLLFKVRMVGLM